MARDPATGTTMEQIDETGWHFGRHDRAFRVEMTPAGPFARHMKMPPTQGSPEHAAAARWAMDIVRSQLARDGIAVQFAEAAG